MPSDRMTSRDGKLSVRSFVTPKEYQAHREPITRLPLMSTASGLYRERGETRRHS